MLRAFRGLGYNLERVFRWVLSAPCRRFVLFVPSLGQKEPPLQRSLVRDNCFYHTPKKFFLTIKIPCSTDKTFIRSQIFISNIHTNNRSDIYLVPKYLVDTASFFISASRLAPVFHFAPIHPLPQYSKGARIIIFNACTSVTQRVSAAKLHDRRVS